MIPVLRSVNGGELIVPYRFNDIFNWHLMQYSGRLLYTSYTCCDLIDIWTRI
jgi:hypothetical protein